MPLTFSAYHVLNTTFLRIIVSAQTAITPSNPRSVNSITATASITLRTPNMKVIRPGTLIFRWTIVRGYEGVMEPMHNIATMAMRTVSERDVYSGPTHSVRI